SPPSPALRCIRSSPPQPAAARAAPASAPRQSSTCRLSPFPQCPKPRFDRTRPYPRPPVATPALAYQSPATAARLLAPPPPNANTPAQTAAFHEIGSAAPLP